MTRASLWKVTMGMLVIFVDKQLKECYYSNQALYFYLFFMVLPYVKILFMSKEISMLYNSQLLNSKEKEESVQLILTLCRIRHNI